MESTPSGSGSSSATSKLIELQAKLASLASSESLLVVVLGPGGVVGDGNPDFDKRFKVRQYIADACRQDRVVFAEDEIPKELVHGGMTRRSEKELVNVADVVLALVPPEGRVSGVFAEIVDFVGMPGVAEKLWVFRPNDRVDLSLDGLGYPERAAYESVDDSRLLNYPPESWPVCNHIRARSVEIVDDMRKVKLARGKP